MLPRMIVLGVQFEYSFGQIELFAAVVQPFNDDASVVPDLVAFWISANDFFGIIELIVQIGV